MKFDVTGLSYAEIAEMADKLAHGTVVIKNLGGHVLLNLQRPLPV